MSRTRRLTIVLLAVFAVVVEGVDVLGHARWRSAVQSIQHDPERGARMIAVDPWLKLPPAVQLSRRTYPRRLSGATRSTLSAALERLAILQKRWMWAHPQGFATSARTALLDEETEAMLAALSQATARDPTSAGLHRFAAFVLRAAGRYQDCLEHLAEASAIAPGRDTLTLEMTEDDARWVDLEGLRRRLDRYPRQRVTTVLDLARELKRRDRVEEGLAQLHELLPEPRVSIEVARWELEAGDVNSATGRLESVASRRAYPASLRASAWALLAEARDAGGDASGASDAARQALKLAPESAAPYLALATLSERRGDYETALDHLRRAWGIAPTNVGLLLRIAAVAERAGKVADARLALERAVEVDPSSADLAARLVDFQLRHGQYMEAALRLSRALDRFPTDDRLLGLAERLRREVGRVGD